MTKGRNFHCHDEEEYCRTGDKVIISQCRKLSKSKNFYIRNIVLAAGRQNFYTKDMSTYEKDAIKYDKAWNANKNLFCLRQKKFVLE